MDGRIAEKNKNIYNVNPGLKPGSHRKSGFQTRINETRINETRIYIIYHQSMSLFRGQYRIESTRLEGYDYSQNGFYFVTVCVKHLRHLLGHIEGNEMILNEYGMILNKCWFDLPNHYPNIILDAFQIMPNHYHAIVQIDNRCFYGLSHGDNPPFQPSPPSIKKHGLFEFMRALNSFSSRRINELRKTPGKSNWQSRFNDRIIRKDGSLHIISVSKKTHVYLKCLLENIKNKACKFLIVRSLLS